MVYCRSEPICLLGNSVNIISYRFNSGVITYGLFSLSMKSTYKQIVFLFDFFVFWICGDQFRLSYMSFFAFWLIHPNGIQLASAFIPFRFVLVGGFLNTTFFHIIF